MKYISIDIETCGIDPDKHTLLQFGAIIEDTENRLSFEDAPKFEVILESPIYHGTPFALAMHKEIFKELALPAEKRTKKIIPIEDLGEMFAMWLVTQGMIVDMTKVNTIVVGGKNFGSFDLQFLLRQESWKKYIQVSHRLIDPAILYFDPKKDDRLPSLEECKIRAGMENTAVAHTTLEDAWDIISLVRFKYPS